jgi:hypothetical protein
MLLCGCPEAATSEERRVRRQLKALLEAAVAQQAESSASRQHSERGQAGAPYEHGPNLPPSQHRDRREGDGAAVSVVKSRLGPNRDAQNIWEHLAEPERSTGLWQEHLGCEVLTDRYNEPERGGVNGSR